MKVYNVAILGTGFGGLCMALRLREQGENDFVLLEKASGVGGTWRDNTYPGAACDVKSHLYWLSFTERPEWSKTYCDQSEILHNIELLAEKSGLKPQIRFNTEVIDATWDEAQLLWRIRTANNETVLARNFVPAWGQLNRPSFAGIAGRERFKGAQFHSAGWRHDVPLQGKRIACIGVGPSAAQFIPELARQAGHLTVFQRSPNYVVPRLDRPYTEDEHRAMPAGRRSSPTTRAGTTRCASTRRRRPSSPQWPAPNWSRRCPIRCCARSCGRPIRSAASASSSPTTTTRPWCVRT
jgi:cation diffusion facilitator CzcD-associated flavoprotein CzcO